MTRDFIAVFLVISAAGWGSYKYFVLTNTECIYVFLLDSIVVTRLNK